MNRDIIISVDRFFEHTHKAGASIGILDLLLLATGKYLLDFFGFEKDDLFIVTIDGPLYRLAKKFPDIPPIYNPTKHSDRPSKVFVDRDA